LEGSFPKLRLEKERRVSVRSEKKKVKRTRTDRDLLRETTGEVERCVGIIVCVLLFIDDLCGVVSDGAGFCRMESQNQILGEDAQKRDSRGAAFSFPFLDPCEVEATGMTRSVLKGVLKVCCDPTFLAAMV